jgi:hypothetical protein
LEDSVKGADGLEGRRRAETAIEAMVAIVNTICKPDCALAIRHMLLGVFKRGPRLIGSTQIGIVPNRGRRYPKHTRSLAKDIRAHNSPLRCGYRHHDEGSYA